MKHSHFFKQDYSYATALAFADFGAQLYEQGFDIAPLNVPTGGASED